MNMLVRHARGLCVATAVVLLAPPSARADDGRARAEELFKDAMQRMAARDYARACPALEEVTRLQPGKVGALIELARCYEESGRLVAAARGYREAAEAAAPSDERGPKARARAEAIAARTPALTVDLALADQARKGLVVQIDGRDLDAATRVPIDPGRHVLTAIAPGKQRWRHDFEVRKEPEILRIQIPALTDDPPPVAPAPAPAPPSPPRAAAPAWAWITGGAGIAMLGVTAGFAGDGLAARSELDRLCGGRLAPCAGHGARELDPLNARKNRDLALTIGLGAAGLGAVIAGVVGVVRGGHARSDEARITVTPIAGPGEIGAVVGRRF